MNRRTITVVILVIFGIGIGIAASFLVSTIVQNADVNPPRENGRENQEISGDSRNEFDTSIEFSSQSQSEIPQNITTLTLSDSTYDRRAEISSWILALDERRLTDWLEQSVDISWNVSSQARSDVQVILLTKLTSYNPNTALDFALARSDPDKAEFIQTVFFEWAVVDVDAAVEQASSIDEVLRRYALQGILKATDSLTLDEHRVIAKRLGVDVYATTYHLKKFLNSSEENPKEIWLQAVAMASLNQEHYQILTQLATSWIESSGIDVLEEVIASMTNIEMRAAVSRSSSY